MRRKNYESELPKNCTVLKTIDAGNKKVGIVFNLIALAVMALTLVGAFLIVDVDFKEVFGVAGLIRLAIFCVVLLAYVVLHELVHGAAYKLLTKQKLKFGLTLSVAFCGVPQIYVYRRTALIAVLAPFFVFLPIFTALPFVLPQAIDKILLSFLWGIHVGGCVGDLYVAGLLLFRFRDPRVLMNDTGPKQTFYLAEKQSETEQESEKGENVEVEIKSEALSSPKEGTPKKQSAQKNFRPKNKKKSKRHGKKKGR